MQNREIHSRPRIHLAGSLSAPRFLAWAGLAVLAAVPRLVGFFDLGLCHFDEGGYAMSAQAIAGGRAPEDLYPLQHYLSPPLYFGASGLLMRLLDSSSDSILFGVSIFFGISTVLLVALLGALWFGRTAGFAAGILVALSDFHVALSRSALTDSTFAAFFLLALVLLTLAERRKSASIAILAGLAIGAAWNTKYHGWFAGVIAAAVFLPRLLKSDRRTWTGDLKRLVFAGLVALLCYLPWFLYVQTLEGGYARLTTEHGRFLIEKWTGYFKSAWVQAGSQHWLSGSMTAVAPLLATLAVFFQWRVRRVSVDGVLLLSAAATLGLGLGGIAIVLVGLISAFHFRPLSPTHRWPQAFFWLFALSSSLYHPYARLLLPLVLASAILAGAGLDAFVRRMIEASPMPRRARFLLIFLVGAAAAGLLVFGRAAPGVAPTACRDLEEAARLTAGLRSAEERVAVLGEPALVFYLRNLGVTSFHIDEPKDLMKHAKKNEEILLLSGIYGRRNPSARNWLDDRASPLTAIGLFAVSPNGIRLLDDFKPAELRAMDPAVSSAHTIAAYRFVAPKR